ncbi:MAG: hypothetical protein WCJ67_11800 [Thermoleophilia bacterium]
MTAEPVYGRGDTHHNAVFAAPLDRRQLSVALHCEKSRKCCHAAGVELRRRLLEQCKSIALRPGGTVDAERDEGVVDVADGENTGFEIEILAIEVQWIAAAIEALVVAADEPRHTLIETSELDQELGATLRVLPDDVELDGFERPGLLQDQIGQAGSRGTQRRTKCRSATSGMPEHLASCDVSRASLRAQHSP